MISLQFLRSSQLTLLFLGTKWIGNSSIILPNGTRWFFLHHFHQSFIWFHIHQEYNPPAITLGTRVYCTWLIWHYFNVFFFRFSQCSLSHCLTVLTSETAHQSIAYQNTKSSLQFWIVGICLECFSWSKNLLILEFPTVLSSITMQC